MERRGVRAYADGMTSPIGAPMTTSSNTSDNALPKIAIVTGGSRGLGRATVLALAERGVDSIFTYHSNRTEADSVSETAAKAGRTAVAMQLDVRDVTSFEAFVQHVREALGRLGAQRFDYLINNAGTSLHESFETTTTAQLDEMYEVHFKAPYLLTQRLLPLMNDGGRIVNISSGLARFSFPGSSAYAAMKGAVEVLTRYLAKELGTRGIAVNTVAPGAIATDFSGGMVRDNPQVNEQIAGATALGRVGLPEDIGPMIASLLSENNRWINAQRIEVSGGMMI